MVFLHNRETQLAIDTLKMFENRDTKANSGAATMLSFIYYLVSNIYKYLIFIVMLTCFLHLSRKFFSKEIMIKLKSMVKQLVMPMLTMQLPTLIYPLVQLEKMN